MKKIFLSVAIAFATIFTAQAQLLSNGDFETPIANGQLPKWAAPSGVVQQLTSVTVNNQTYVSQSGPNFVLLQNNANIAILRSDKFPLSTRPVSLKFLATYLPATPATESFGFLIFMTKNNGNQVDTVMNSILAASPGTKYPWVNFTIDLANYYRSAATPDSAIILFVTSVTTPTQGSSLLIDDVQFSNYGLGVKGFQSYFSSDVKVTPNPVVAASEINISYQLNSNSKVMVELHDMQGRIVRSLSQETASYGSYNKTMSVEGLPAGVYVCKVTANDQAKTTKIVISQ